MIYLALLEGRVSRISNRDIQYHVQYEFLICKGIISLTAEKANFGRVGIRVSAPRYIYVTGFNFVYSGFVRIILFKLAQTF